MTEPQFPKSQIAAEAFVIFATLHAIVACAVAWGVL